MNPSTDVSSLPLRDIHLPDAVSWWPPAPGWWLLLALAAAAVAYAGYRHYRYRRHRAALRAIAGIAKALDGGDEPVRCLQTLSVVLRRFVMTVTPSADAAGVPGLAGTRWLDYLDGRWDRGGFHSEVGKMLLDAPYAPERRVSPEHARALTQLCADFIKAQRPGA